MSSHRLYPFCILYVQDHKMEKGQRLIWKAATLLYWAVIPNTPPPANALEVAGKNIDLMEYLPQCWHSVEPKREQNNLTAHKALLFPATKGEMTMEIHLWPDGRGWSFTPLPVNPDGDTKEGLNWFFMETTFLLDLFDTACICFSGRLVLRWRHWCEDMSSVLSKPSWSWALLCLNNISQFWLQDISGQWMVALLLSFPTDPALCTNGGKNHQYLSWINARNFLLLVLYCFYTQYRT